MFLNSVILGRILHVKRPRPSNDSMLDGNGVVNEVDNIPFYPKNLTPSQTQEHSQHDYDFQRVTFGLFQKLMYLLFVIELRTCEFGFLGFLNPRHRIKGYEILSDSTVQALGNICQVPVDCICRHGLQGMVDELLDVSRGHIPHL